MTIAAQIVLRLAPDGTIQAEAPGQGGAPRRKVTTGKIPSWIVEELTTQQAAIDAREAAKAEADERVKAEIAARQVPVNARTVLPKHRPSRSLIFNETTANHGRAFAFKTIGTPRRGEREDFLARPKGSSRDWQHVTIYDEAPATWCARNGWERPKGARNLPKNPTIDSSQVGI